MFGAPLKRYEVRVISFLRGVTAAGLALLIFVSCAITPRPTRSVHVGLDNSLGVCADFFAAVDDRVITSRAIDPGDFRVEHFPYLRTNRFLASFAGEISDEAAFSAWVDRMMGLDRQARRFEIANLEDTAYDHEDDINHILNRIRTCGNLLKQADLQDPTGRSSLKESVQVPDDYIELRRWLGLYPLVRIFVSLGVSTWHREARNTFSNLPPAAWRANRYQPHLSPQTLSGDRLLQNVKRDALGIPELTYQDQQQLFRMFAPVWEVRDGGADDRIGRPYWRPDGSLGVDTDEPLTYTLVSFTRFKGRILTQLNYIVWFPARPKKHPFDLFGGLLDGLIYRVTLDESGAPLLYETVHNCGCYYKAYPTDRLIAVENSSYAEPPLVLKAPEMVHTESVMTIAMEAGTHYVEHLYPVARRKMTARPKFPAGSEESYSLAGYDDLRSLQMAKGKRRSMFGQNSIATGSERLERLILWPTGVYSPGAMRQWGRHAVAFAGKRHFDDPFYMDHMFRLK